MSGGRSKNAGGCVTATTVGDVGVTKWDADAAGAVHWRRYEGGLRGIVDRLDSGWRYRLQRGDGTEIRRSWPRQSSADAMAACDLAASLYCDRTRARVLPAPPDGGES